jgi:predicted small lipoprotein YifL
MKKLILTFITAAALASLSACSTVDKSNTASTSSTNTVDSGPQSLVPSPGNSITTTDPMPIPNAAGQGAAPQSPAGQK